MHFFQYQCKLKRGDEHAHFLQPLTGNNIAEGEILIWHHFVCSIINYHMESKKQQPLQNAPQEDGKGETIRELARRHLLNEDHVTTDEELKNAKLELDGEIELSNDRHDLADGDNKSNNSTRTTIDDIIEEKGLDKKDIPNPYDILNP